MPSAACKYLRLYLLTETRRCALFINTTGESSVGRSVAIYYCCERCLATAAAPAAERPSIVYKMLASRRSGRDYSESTSSPGGEKHYKKCSLYFTQVGRETSVARARGRSLRRDPFALLGAAADERLYLFNVFCINLFA
jgi:hypothetical protein